MDESCHNGYKNAMAMLPGTGNMELSRCGNRCIQCNHAENSHAHKNNSPPSARASLLQLSKFIEKKMLG